MGFDAIQYYFESGWQALMGQATFNLMGLASLFNLVTVLDIILVLLLMWWLWWKIRGTALLGLIPKLTGILIILFISKLLGFLAVFYMTSAGLVVVLIAAGIIYNQDFKKIFDGDSHYSRLAKRSILDGNYDAKRFFTELSDTVVTLARTKTSALLVIKTDESLGKLAATGTPLGSPFTKEFVLDVFSHRSKLAAGAMIIDNGVIVAAGSTLSTTPPKRFMFSLTNPAVQQAAKNHDALIIVTHKDKEEISLLHKSGIYTKLTPRNLDRVLKPILLG